MPRPLTSLTPTTSIAHRHRIWLFYFDQDNPQEVADPLHLLNQAAQLPLTAIMLPKGLARAYYPPKNQTVPLIIQLNGKSVITSDHQYTSPIVCTIEEALQLEAKAVAYTIYLGSTTEGVMLQEFGRISRQAKKMRLHSLAIIKVVDQAGRPDRHSNMLAYAAQVALSLSADYVQLSLSSDPQKYAHVTQAAGKTHVITDLSTHQPDTPADLIKPTQIIAASGAAGIALDQSMLSNLDPKTTTRLKQLIFGFD